MGRTVIRVVDILIMVPYHRFAKECAPRSQLINIARYALNFATTIFNDIAMS